VDFEMMLFNWFQKPFKKSIYEKIAMESTGTEGERSG
jgi:hypothetical protein